MEGSSWWPVGIATGFDETSVFTKWGSLPLHWDEAILTPKWWSEQSDYWGRWPEVKFVEKLNDDEYGIWCDIGEFIAQIIPIPTGNHVSRLVQNEKLNLAVKEYVTLPVAGINRSGDFVLIFPKKSKVFDIIGLHKSLISSQFTTPNDELNWNSRLKKVEDKLKTNTLWRAPHHKSTLGMPRLNIVNNRPSPIMISEKLLTEVEHLPMLRQAIELEKIDEWNTEFGTNSLMRTSTGGLAHMTYDVMVMAHAQCRAFGKTDSKIESYLAKVDRIQADLGIMRLVRMGVPFGLVCAIFTLWINRAGMFESWQLPFIVFLSMSIISWIAYRILEPDWRQL
jgi:hypothetical protein